MKTPQDVIAELRRQATGRPSEGFVELRGVAAGCSNIIWKELADTCDLYAELWAQIAVMSHRLELAQSRESALSQRYQNAVTALQSIHAKCGSMFSIHSMPGGDARLSVEMREVADYAREALLSIGELPTS